MSTYTNIIYQIVFGSKNITSFLNADNKHDLFNYMAGIIWNRKCIPYIVGGYSNHIHIIVFLHPSISLADLVKEIKKASDSMMRGSPEKFSDFPGWQVGYGGFTYSISSKENLVRYVENQDSHHTKKKFIEEYIQLLKEQDINFRREYLFS